MDEDSSQNKRKAMDTEKESIFKILEELGKKDFKKFKWYLEHKNVEGLEPLKKMDLEKADNRMHTTDLIVQTYTINAAQIVKNVLKKIDRNDLLEKHSMMNEVQPLLQSATEAVQRALIENVSDVGESSGSSLLTASSQPPQEDGTKQKTLMDKIEPVTPLNPLKEPGVSPDRTLRTTAMQNNKCPPIASKLPFMRMMTDTQFKHFKTSLIECDCVDCDHALRLLDPTDESLPPIGEEEGGEKTSVTIQYRDESDDEDAGTTDEGIRTGELRKYQTELAQPVYERQNTIICAPTGCGKTRVALAISDHHLKTAHPGSKKPKVVFMVTTVVLCEQQLQWFQEYFNIIPNIRIKGLCGEQADQISLSSIVETNDIIVLTPQILVNALQKNDITSLSCFSLLIFDECHNTGKQHPYNIIMFKYLDNQLDNTGDTLPQIVGLTASVGIGSFKNKSEAVSNISRLCANLNSKVISTVKENKEELRLFVRVPKKEFYLVEERSSTSEFIRVIQDLMRRIETEAKRVYNIDSLSSIPSSDYGSKKYEQWIVDVQKKCMVQQRDDISEEKQSHACRALYNYTEHLRKYNDALIINEDARTKDALDFLSVFIEQEMTKQAGNDETEKQLIQYFQDQEVYLRELTTGGQHENPKLSKLQDILQNKYREKPDTRTVVFVKTRALAYALKRWIEETDLLKYLKPEVLLGRRRHQLELTGSGHMTLNKRVLERFKSSSNQSNLLIATSVGEEGIDLPLCNLIIMYENVGNVVKMIQVRGRGRAQDSVCILLSNKRELIDKEKMNMQKESIVEEAVHYIQTHSQELDDKMCEFQNEGRVQRQQKPSPPVKQEGEYTLNCVKCRRKACSSDDIRVLDCHHLVLDHSLFGHTELHPKPKVIDGVAKKWKLFCADCKQDWGIVATFKNKDLPIIKIDSFTVRREEDKKLLSFKKWKDVPFPIKPFDLSEVPHDWPALDLL